MPVYQIQEAEIIALRFGTTSTNRNLAAVLDLLNSQETRQLTLFASPSAPSETMFAETETNLPLLSALAEINVPGLDVVSIVYDGDFLTAQRAHRASEIGHLLDQAVGDKRVVFGTQPAPFTSRLDPDVAAAELRKIPTGPLTPEGKELYWSMLSNMPYGSWKD